MKRILTALGLIACAFLAGAVSQRKPDIKQPCDGANGTQAEANACARLKYKRADAEMNRVYEQLESELSGYGNDDGLRKKLKRAQTLWLQYRAADCESEASVYRGGSIRPAIYDSCLASITEERMRRMKTFLAEIEQ